MTAAVALEPYLTAAREHGIGGLTQLFTLGAAETAQIRAVCDAHGLPRSLVLTALILRGLAALDGR